MTRYNSSSLQAMAEDSLVAFRLLADVGVTSGTLHFVTGRQATVYNSNTYTPVGGFGYVNPIQEDTDTIPRDVVFGLSGVNTLALTYPGSFSVWEPLQEHMLNRPVTFYRQFLDPTNLTAVHTPEPLWKGRITNVDVDIENGVYEIRASDARRRTARVRYFNAETFRAVDSSDTFGDWINSIPLYKSNWAGTTVDFSGARGPTFRERLREARNPAVYRT